MIRKLNNGDYNKGYLNLLAQLTPVGTLSEDTFDYFVEMQDDTALYKTFVYELDNKLVGCITILIEQKLSHEFKRVMHIEDVVTDSEYRGRGIASKLLNYAREYAVKWKCYKIILDCDKSKKDFYNKNGFTESGIQMSIRL
jgi:glucosamine-phosphate N-acetyltransferase